MHRGWIPYPAFLLAAQGMGSDCDAQATVTVTAWSAQLVLL